MNDRKFSEYKGALPLQFVDIYGNLICGDDAEVRQKLLDVARDQRNQIQIMIGKKTIQGEAAESLGSGTPGVCLAYPNEGHIDIAQKWHNGVKTTFGDEESAYHLFDSQESLWMELLSNFQMEQLRRFFKWLEATNL